MTLSAPRSFARHFRSSLRIVMVSLAFAILQSALLIPIAFLVRDMFDDVIPSGDVITLIYDGLLILALYLSSAICGLTTRYVALRASKVAITELRTNLLERLLRFRQSFFDQVDTARLHATVVQDTERWDVMANALVGQLVPSILVGLALTVALVVMSPILFLTLFALVPILIVTTRLLGRSVRTWTRRYHVAFDTFSAEMAFALRSMYLTKARAAEALQIERRREQFLALGEAGRSMAWYQALYTLANGSVAAIASVILLVVGGSLVATDRMTIGELLSFFAVVALLRARVSTILTTTPQVIAGIESLRRLEQVLAIEEPEPYTGTRAIDFDGAVRLEGVEFAYGERPILVDANLEVSPGERIALVGPNGAGKSTIVSLVLGLYRPQSGRLLADASPYDEVDLREVRRSIGVVLQDPLLFRGTIRENIAFGPAVPLPGEVEEAAERSTASVFVERLPDGYETEIGAEGVQLSAGQRQRVAIARALVGRPALIILDEAATYLDPVSTAALVDNLGRLPWNPALLVIGHDDVLLADVDRVYRLVDGRTELIRGAPQATRA